MERLIRLIYFIQHMYINWEAAIETGSLPWNTRIWQWEYMYMYMEKKEQEQSVTA